VKLVILLNMLGAFLEREENSNNLVKVAHSLFPDIFNTSSRMNACKLFNVIIANLIFSIFQVMLTLI
jgi:hypothetical protein